MFESDGWGPKDHSAFILVLVFDLPESVQRVRIFVLLKDIWHSDAHLVVLGFWVISQLQDFLETFLVISGSKVVDSTAQKAFIFFVEESDDVPSKDSNSTDVIVILLEKLNP